MPYPDVLVEVALSCIHRQSPSFTDAAGLQEIRNAFCSFVKGTTPAETIANLLHRHISNIQPLELITSILQVPDEPPSLSHREGECHIRTACRRKPRPWSGPEDTRLLAGIYRYGFDNWAGVADFVGNGRVRAQCAQRWMRGLNPRISKDQWSDAEDQQFLALIQVEGTKMWTKIASEMGNRSDVQCRYHFAQLERDGKLPAEFNARPEKVKREPQSPLLNRRRPARIQTRSAFSILDEAPIEVPEELPADLSLPPVQPNVDVLNKAEVHAIRLPDPSEAIDWSIPSEDDGEQASLFGDQLLW
jgi:hypothetical protein